MCVFEKLVIFSQFSSYHIFPSLVKSFHLLHENPLICGHLDLWISNFIQSWRSLYFCPWKFFFSLTGGISYMWISKFSSTMVKSFTLVHENSSIWGHFRPVNFKIFFNHGEVTQSCPWKSFYLGAFQTCEFQKKIQPWWSHSLFSMQILQSRDIFERENWPLCIMY